MRSYSLRTFGLDGLEMIEAPAPRPESNEVLLDVKALSLNYRDLLVAKGLYNPRLTLPVTPISDGAGVISAIGSSVTQVRVGNRVCSHFVAGWLDGPFRGEYLKSTLGTPGAGLAAEQVALPADAVVPIPASLSFGEAATLPIAALTAWSALVTEGGLSPDRPNTGKTVLTLGTGGVSIFALQFAKALGARAIITSSSDEKLARAKRLGADHGVNYRAIPEWDKAVRAATDGQGVDIVVENGGGGTLDLSIAATRPGGTVALLGVLAGGKGEINTAQILMKRIHIAGIMVDSRAAFEQMNRFIQEKGLKPVIDRTFEFDRLPDALRHLESGSHFGKIVIEC